VLSVVVPDRNRQLIPLKKETALSEPRRQVEDPLRAGVFVRLDNDVIDSAISVIVFSSIETLGQYRLGAEPSHAGLLAVHDRRVHLGFPLDELHRIREGALLCETLLALP